MPENMFQWLWYAFFFGGAIGGWIIIAMCGAEVVSMIRRAREWHYDRQV